MLRTGFGDMKMRYNYFIATVVGLVCVWSFQMGCQRVLASEEPNEAAAVSEPGPRIKFENVVHDFGKVGPGTSNTCEFKFTNVGDELLEIIKVDKSCGCTPYTLEKKKYAPGESGTLKVKYSASKRPGSTKKHLYVRSNDKVQPKIALTVKAKIEESVSVQPKILNLFLNKKNGGCPEITLRSLGEKPISIKGFEASGRFKSTGRAITAEFDPSVKSKKLVLEPKVNMSLLKKNLSGSVKITVLNPQETTITIPFKVLPQFKLDPPSLVVYKAEPEKPVTKELWILDNYGKDVEVESVSSKEGIIKVLSREMVDKRCKIELEITPPARKGSKRVFSDVLYVNIKDSEPLKVTCRGFYVKGTKGQASSGADGK